MVKPTMIPKENIVISILLVENGKDGKKAVVVLNTLFRQIEENLRGISIPMGIPDSQTPIYFTPFFAGNILL